MNGRFDRTSGLPARTSATVRVLAAGTCMILLGLGVTPALGDVAGGRAPFPPSRLHVLRAAAPAAGPGVSKEFPASTPHYVAQQGNTPSIASNGADSLVLWESTGVVLAARLSSDGKLLDRQLPAGKSTDRRQHSLIHLNDVSLTVAKVFPPAPRKASCKNSAT